jgi:hypothetical protein
VHALIAGVTPDNTPGGYNWTYLFPMLLFIVIALVLWAQFGRPHQRVPTRRISLGLSSGAPDRRRGAHAASAVGGLSTAPGGASQSPAEPADMHPSAEPGSAAGGDGSDGAQPPADGAGASE